MFHLAASYLRSAGWSEWDVLQLTGGRSVVWWIFRRGQDFPAIVGKLCGQPGAVEAARRECAVLKMLGPFAERLGAPHVLFQADAGGAFVCLQSGLPGKPLRDELSPSDSRRLTAQFDIAESWLEKFQSLVPPAEDSVAAFRQILAGASEGLPEPLLSSAAEALPRLSAVPAVAVHGDFWAKNVLVAPGRVSVVDWNTFHYGAPVEDLFRFATGTVYPWRLGAEEAAEIVWSIFFGSSPLALRTRAAAARTLDRWKLSQALLGPLFLMSLVSQLSRTEFLDNAAWRAFALRYVAAGLPKPWPGSTAA